MLDEYEFYQGVVLRQLVVAADFTLMIRPFEKHGRINAFVINGKIGVFVKHSTKRMSPWRFTFHIDQVSDLLDLTTAHSNSFVVFVCGEDGVATLPVGDVYQIVSFQGTENAWVRVERKRREQYGVAGNRSELSYKVANGTSEIIEATKAPLRIVRSS